MEREGLLTLLFFDSNSSGYCGEGISNSIRHVMVIERAFFLFVIFCMAGIFQAVFPFVFFFKQKTAYEIGVRLVGSEMCIRDRIPAMQNITKRKKALSITITCLIEFEIPSPQ